MLLRGCCPRCFGDENIFDYIVPSSLIELGNCSFCGEHNVGLVEPIRLRDHFEMLVRIYERHDHGNFLVEWLKEDWQLFDHPKMDSAHSKELLGEILDDGEIVRQLFMPSASYASHGLTSWEELCDEVMYRNRWFLENAIDTERLANLLGQLLAKNVPTQWFRSRIIDADGPCYAIGDMGPPPRRKASHGRANPAGIPYLYLGSKPETAIAEIRPHTGEAACVAEFELGDIRAVDLRNPRKRASPFILSDSSDIGMLRADLPFLERLGEELTRPVLPYGAAIDYIPSQYLCEFIKKCGFDGVIYRSSVSDGFNLALFDPAQALGRSVQRYKIEKVEVSIREAPDNIGPLHSRNDWC